MSGIHGDDVDDALLPLFGCYRYKINARNTSLAVYLQPYSFFSHIQ